MDGFSIDMHGQCAWCVMVEDGPYAGRPLFKETSQGVTPLLVNGYTHGICPTCDAILRGKRQLKRIQRNVPAVYNKLVRFVEKE